MPRSFPLPLALLGGLLLAACSPAAGPTATPSASTPTPKEAAPTSTPLAVVTPTATPRAMQAVTPSATPATQTPRPEFAVQISPEKPVVGQGVRITVSVNWETQGVDREGRIFWYFTTTESEAYAVSVRGN